MKNQCLSKLFTFFIFVLLTTSSGVYAQPKRLQFNHLTADDGLSSSIVTSILQDHKGFVWIGTYDGLNRYDGFDFVVYRSNSDSVSLTSNVVRTIIEDHNKNLVIGTQHGLCLYDWVKDRFLNYMLDKSSPLKGIDCLVTKIAEDSLGNLWLATNIGLIYFDRVKNQIVKFNNNPNNPESLSYDFLESVMIDKHNRLWITTRKGLNLFLPETRTFKHFTRSESSTDDLSNTFFTEMTEDHQGNLWFGSTEGLYCMKRITETSFTNLIHYQHDVNDKSSLSINQIKSLCVDDENNLWIGTENGGLDLFDRDNQQFWHYRKDDYDPKSLNNESIQTIYQDKKENLWLGTFTGGLNIMMGKKDAITSYINLPGAPFSLSHNTVTCFLENHDGQIWVGTDGGGLNLFDMRTNRFQRFNMDNSNLSSNAVLCMFEDRNHQVWFGTWAGGLVRLENNAKSFTSFTTKNSGIQDDCIYAIAEGDNDDLWLGTFAHGLIHFQIKEKKFTNYAIDNSGLLNEQTIKIKKYSKGRFIIGSTNCFQIFSPSENRFITYLPNPNNANSLSSPTTTDILVENDTCVWIGTRNGLNRFNPKTKTFIRYFKKDGLPDNFIKGLILDTSGFLWVTTNMGASRFDYEQGKFKNYTKADGFQSNEFTERSILKAKNGALLMGGTKGFSIVYPEKITENKSIPEILITDIKIFNKSVKPDTENSPLIQNISETKKLTLSYKESVLTFYFAAMDFTAPEKNQYAYKMDGFDKDWIYSENRREVTYTNLDPGEYVLHVKGSNNDGIWNEKGVSLSITILPPWWKTLWFRVLILFLLLVGIYLAYYLKVASYRNKQKELSELVKKRTAEITQANKELLERQTLIENQSEELRLHSENLTEANELLIQKQTVIKSQSDEILEANTELVKLNKTKDRILSIIAHDLRNPFNVVSGFSEILLEEYRDLPLETIEMYLSLISNASKNGNILLGNLLQWSRTQTGSITFEPVPLKLRLVAEETYNFLEGDALKKNISVLLKIDSALEIVADENMVKTILRNLLSNAIKFTRDKGIISLSATLSPNQVEICVSDSGVGIPQEKIPLLFRIETNTSTKGTSQESGSGLGLILCKEFVERHGGKIWVESIVGVGTQFKFTLPVM